MYNTFFGLSRSPFELSPDPYFIFPSAKTKEALASIYYAMCQRKGFVVVSGEVGTGKTLMVRCLLELLKRQQIPFANIFNPRLSVVDFLGYMTLDLGISVPHPSKGKILQTLYTFLLEQLSKGLTTVLVVDEAHQMSPNLLEEIRLLTNLETSKQKLMQILLVGQPELEDKLDSYELRQVKQRIAIRCRLEALSADETRAYIERRLMLAGAKGQATTIFPGETVEAIYRYSRGVPRMINSICDQAMIAAYARQVLVVAPEMIDEVGNYYRFERIGDRGKDPELAVEGESPKSLNQLMQSIESESGASMYRGFL